MDEHQSTEPESMERNSKTIVPRADVSCFFGVGCWDFGIQWRMFHELTVQEYIAKLKEQLETISSINNLTITADAEDVEEKVDAHYAHKTDDGIVVWAQGIASRMEFDLYIPLRIQDDLAAGRVRPGTGTENFRIHVICAYYSPVVFVELLNPREPCTPSTAMVVIREYSAE